MRARLAFQVLKSLIPLTLLGLALLGAVGRQDVWTKHIAPALKSRLDPPVFHAIDFAVEKIFASNSAGLIAFSAVVTVWFVPAVSAGSWALSTASTRSRTIVRSGFGGLSRWGWLSASSPEWSCDAARRSGAEAGRGVGDSAGRSALARRAGRG